MCSLSIFVLQRRNLLSHGAAMLASTPPSGSVPGRSRSGGACWLFITGDAHEFDRVFVIVTKVFFVKGKDPAAFSFSCKVLFVNVHPPLK
jgi:hypothetical protein